MPGAGHHRLVEGGARASKIFVDYNQTARDRTIASAYSVRPRPHAAGLRAAALGRGATPRCPSDFDLVTMPAPLRRGRRRARRHGRRTPSGWTPLLELADRDERDHGLGDLPYPPDHPKMPGEPKRVQPSRAEK